MGFLVHKEIMKTVIGCRSVSNRIITVRLRASPFNIPSFKINAPTSSHGDKAINEFYSELKPLVDQTPNQVILVGQVD